LKFGEVLQNMSILIDFVCSMKSHISSAEKTLRLEELQETPAADFVFPAEWNGALVTGQVT
jgi:hypothetical protein